MEKYVAKYGRMHPDEIDALIEARSIPMLELAIARIYQEAGTKGDFQRLGFLLDRAGLKPKPIVEIEDDGVKSMPHKDLLEIVRGIVAQPASEE